jgi:hypothetical protein
MKNSNNFKNIRSKMPNKFICEKCGSEELAFGSYAKCLIPVVVREGIFEYLEAVVNSDDYIQSTGYFCCSECGPIGNHLQTEQDLLKYLTGETLNHDQYKKF